MIMSDKVWTDLKEAIVVYFKFLVYVLPGGGGGGL
jgi:hypothetical protein